MRKLVRNSLLLASALALALTGCRPPLNLVHPGGSGFVGGVSAGGVSLEPAGNGGMNVSIKWPPPMQRATQAIPAVANTLHLKVTTREGIVKASQIFNRPATIESLISTASLTVGVGSSLLVEVNAYRQQFATDSVGVLPSAEQIIAQGTQENVTITLNATTSVRLQLDPDVTVAGIGGAASLGLDKIPWSVIEYDPRGPAIWTELNTPENLVYDREGKYLYFTERPDPGRLPEGYRIMRLSLNSSDQSTGSYGVMTLVAGGASLNTALQTSTDTAPYYPITGLRSVASDASGNLYYVEQGLVNRVRKIAPNNQVSTFALGLVQPEGLLVHGDRVYVTDTGRSQVKAFGSNGSLLWTAGGGSENQDGASTSFVPLASASIPGPTGLAVSGNSMFVATTAGRVLEINLATVGVPGASCVRTLTGLGGTAPGGSSQRMDQTTFGVLRGIAASGSILYLSDESNRGIWQVPASSESTLTQTSSRVAGFREANLETGAFASPAGLLLVGNTLYVADPGFHRVEKIDLSDPSSLTTTHFAGRNDGLADMIDGPSISGDYATLSSPRTLATRSVWTDLVVADTGSARLRGVTTGGVLSTLAGFWNASRLSRGVGLAAHQLHMGEIAGLCLEPTTGATSRRLYALTSDEDAAAGGQAVYRVSGLDNGDFGPKTYEPQEVNAVVKTELLFENMLSRLGGLTPRVIDTPSGIGVDPVSKNVVFSVSGTYHMLMRWLPGFYEIAFPYGNLPGQGYARFAGTGAQGYTGNGPASLVQLNQPRRIRYDGQGNCYFLTLNGSGQTILRRVGTNGGISTIAGGGSLAVPQVTGPQVPVSAVQANLGTVADYDIDSQGNFYLASGTRILRLDQRAATMVEVYNSTSRTFTSIAFDENDAAILFACNEEPKIKKVYLSRLF